MMHAVVVGGSPDGGPLDQKLLAHADLLVAVDAGADALRAVGIVPQVFVGDMDSVSGSARVAFAEAGVETLVLPRTKDETDTEAALRLVRERGADSITVLRVLGGPRVDHLLAAVFLLDVPWLEEAEVRLLDGDPASGNEVTLSRGRVVLEGRPGDLVSLLPLDAEATGVTTEGLAYPLHGETLRRCEGRGVSNELVAARALVEHESGRLLVTHYRERAVAAVPPAPCAGAHSEPADKLPAAAQFSLYPLEQPDIGPPIQAAIGEAAGGGAAVNVGRLSTFLEGTQGDIFASLAAAFSEARKTGPTVMVTVMASGAPTVEKVAEIQAERVEGRQAARQRRQAGGRSPGGEAESGPDVADEEITEGGER